MVVLMGSQKAVLIIHDAAELAKIIESIVLSLDMIMKSSAFVQGPQESRIDERESTHKMT